MPVPTRSRVAVFAALAAAAMLKPAPIHAGLLDDIGVTILQSPSVQPGLNGSGIVVGIAEAANLDASQHSLNNFILNPAGASMFPDVPVTFVNNSGTSVTLLPNYIGFPPSVGGVPIGSVSGHGTEVARVFVGSLGLAPHVAGVYNFEADFFINHIVIPDFNFPIDPNLRVVNQSFVFDDSSQYNLALQVYDNFVVARNVVVVSAAGNGPGSGMPTVQLPAAAYNSISVGALELIPGSTGTLDGRSKVDITAPGTDFGMSGPASSFSTPVVSGVATLLIQAGSLGLAGPGTPAFAMDARTIKSLLLTGATKTSTWSHTVTNPLDTQVGAGIVNAYASYRILTAGQYTPSSRSSVAIGGLHPAVTTNPVPKTGWTLQNDTVNSNLATSAIFSTVSTDGVNHFAITLPQSGFHYVLTATLTWNRPFDTNLSDENWSKLNNLDLFLYNGSSAISSSTSSIDNVEHIFAGSLNPGTYDLQVLKHGGFLGTAGVVTNAEAYALSWSAQLLGDTNWDGIVDIVDLSNVANHWQTAQRSVFNGDVNGDGYVDILDYSTVATNWQSGASGGALAMPSLASLLVSTPEPGTIALLMLGGVPLLMRRRRRMPTA